MKGTPREVGEPTRAREAPSLRFKFTTAIPPRACSTCTGSENGFRETSAARIQGNGGRLVHVTMVMVDVMVTVTDTGEAVTTTSDSLAHGRRGMQGGMSLSFPAGVLDTLVEIRTFCCQA